MENASRAIIMAGGMLIALVIMAVVVLLFNILSDVNQEEKSSLSVEQLEEYNRQFSLYDRSLYGSELLSLANLIEDYENRQEEVVDRIEVQVTITKEIIGYGPIESLRPKKYTIQEIKQYNDKIEQELNKNVKNTEQYENIKSITTQLKSTPFQSISTSYNRYGRISKMEFIDKSSN